MDLNLKNEGFQYVDWKYQFNQKDLKKAQDLTLVNVERKDDTITADIKDSEFKIEIQIKYNSPITSYAIAIKRIAVLMKPPSGIM